MKHSKTISIDNARDAKPKHMHWRKKAGYLIRSDAGGLDTMHETADTLTEARKIARARIKAGYTTWAEVFRWAESGVSLRKFHVCTYDRELTY